MQKFCITLLHSAIFNNIGQDGKVNKKPRNSCIKNAPSPGKKDVTKIEVNKTR